jgi:hypothetical protein
MHHIRSGPSALMLVLGLYSVTDEAGHTSYFSVIKNICPPKYNIVYDLKGSLSGRYVDPKSESLVRKYIHMYVLY